jgi:hypothetical protein
MFIKEYFSIFLLYQLTLSEVEGSPFFAVYPTGTLHHYVLCLSSPKCLNMNNHGCNPWDEATITANAERG